MQDCHQQSVADQYGHTKVLTRYHHKPHRVAVRSDTGEVRALSVCGHWGRLSGFGSRCTSLGETLGDRLRRLAAHASVTVRADAAGSCSV